MSGQQTATGPARLDPGSFERLLGWLPAWLGFALIALAGSSRSSSGSCSRARASSPSGSRPSPARASPGGPADGASHAATRRQELRAVISRLDGWQWLVIFGLFVVAIIVTVVT